MLEIGAGVEMKVNLILTTVIKSGLIFFFSRLCKVRLSDNWILPRGQVCR